MKIYAARQPKSDLEVFNNIVGTDLWLEVSCRSFGNRFLHILRTEGRDKFLVLNMPKYLMNDFYLRSRYEENNPFDELIVDLLTKPQRVAKTAYGVHYPLNYMTTDELFAELGAHLAHYTKYSTNDMLNMLKGTESL